jgi:hypothetical protein
MGVDGECYAPAALPPGKRPDSSCTGGFVGFGASVEECDLVSTGV